MPFANSRKRRRKTNTQSLVHWNSQPSPTVGTLSVAVPGSILENIHKPQLQTYVIGQLARTLTIFKVDEVVLYTHNQDNEEQASVTFIALLLRYLETPQYLRKHLFPMSDDLKYAGLLNPIDAPHHIRKDEWLPWREGVVLKQGQDDTYSVDVGLDQLARVKTQQSVKIGERVTVCFQDKSKQGSELSGGLCSKTTPRKERGLYWGYQVRIATTLCKTWEECPFEGGYDRVIGTSERGKNMDSPSFRLSCRHLLLVFGGRRGLEYDASRDDKLSAQGVGRRFGVEELFHDYINVCPFQGSRTIRTEEAVLIALSRLQPFLYHRDS